MKEELKEINVKFLELHTAAEMNGEPTTFFMSALIGFWFANIKPAKSDKPRNTRTTILLLETYL